MVNVVRYWFPACVLNDGKGCADCGNWGGTHSCVCLRRDPQYERFRLKNNERKASEGEREKVTVASIHEGEEEKKSHPRKEIQIDFPQQFLFVNTITAFFCRLSGARLVDLHRLFLFGHVWGDERRDGGKEMQVGEPYLTTAGTVLFLSG